MILADTSIWIDFLRGSDNKLQTLLAGPGLLCHPMIIGELACGTLPDRESTLHKLQNMQPAEVVKESVLLSFIESHVLFGRGLGYVDIHLLASTRLGDARWLWTKDKRLGAVAEELGVNYTYTS